MSIEGPKREIWSIWLHDDNRDGVYDLEVCAEYVIRNAAGDRMVYQGMQPLATRLGGRPEANETVTLPDGHKTTIADIVAGLRAAAGKAFDMYEGTVDDHADARPDCFIKMLREHRTGHRVMK